jgi:5'(3')-deoxyribonucleotidase
MDGTIANLYGVNGWLEMLIAHDETPYRLATTLVNMNTLARYLNKLQKKGYEIGIISWLAKNSTQEYDENVTRAKKNWLKKHLRSVKFDFVEIVAYGTDKNIVAVEKTDILFDDEEKNRNNWAGIAYDVDNILETLRGLM